MGFYSGQDEDEAIAQYGGMTLNIRIAIVGLGDFIDIAKRVANDFQKDQSIDIKVLENPEDVTQLVPRLQSDNTDIIITGRLNKMLMETKTNIPVINLKLTPTDILIALAKSVPYSRNIAIALPDIEDLEYDYSLLQDLLNIKLVYITYGTDIELDFKIAQFSKTKGSIIGTGTAVDSAKKFGLNSTLIYSEYSVVESINRALEIVRFKRHEERHRQQLSG
ncbi:PrpR N-terminal domain-containing protein [Alicyclobacillus acidoterrestris]|uniref:PrpR N-terminal domain-containing protein n=1 Tax=Alicyclobacillus acidoterrestris (strain ATCC 49025 / DSM 3922 / CIP 106132 / NCIMB 13137 / GD3B) TaxID=1356854 RepID=T0BE25_ALIAG|nr:PrpR N-terminal domain-containing protein [Alicyclobacillus acidoterrestris]EPZ42268.1 hypothetical protein N007_15540 [Alicyclobacillus acidoterrestris ATCC 49025]UNO48607.1 PrpR N-terminal domain-containing protein [Alicyclobacillus acidoterrestris]